MSLIKQLKEDPSNSINIAEILQTSFKGKTKYTELFLKLIKNKFKKVDNDVRLERDVWLMGNYNFSTEDVKDLSNFDEYKFYLVLLNLLDERERSLMFDFYSFKQLR